MNSEIARSVAKNTTVMMSSQMITWLSSFILMLFLPRYLGSEEYGRLYLAISVTTIQQILIEFGGNYYLAKEIACRREQAALLLSNAIGLRTVLWGLSLLLMFAFARAAGYSREIITLLVVLGVSKLWEGARSTYYSCFQGIEKMQFPSLGAIVERAFVATAGVVALLFGAGALTIALLMGISTLLNLLVVTRFTPHIAERFVRPRWSEMKNIAAVSVPYFLCGMFSVIYYRIDAAMLPFWVPDAVVGWYGAAYRFFDVLMFLPSIFSIAVFPVLSKLWEKEDDSLASTTQKSLHFILLAGIPISISVFAFSDEIIAMFFGAAEFGPSSLLLKIFSAGLLLVYIDFVLGTTLFASDRQKKWTVVACIAMFLNPALNYFLIPMTQFYAGNGGIGAAIATLLTEFFIMIMALLLLPADILGKTKAGAPAYGSVEAKGILSGAFMIATLAVLRSAHLPWLISTIMGFGVYGVALVSLKAVEPQEMIFLKLFFSYRNLKTLFVFSQPKADLPLAEKEMNA
ncbi:MAG: flippase [Bacteroidota bacterium]|nr:flippase [Bacteroidota bacterium]